MLRQYHVCSTTEWARESPTPPAAHSRRLMPRAWRAAQYVLFLVGIGLGSVLWALVVGTICGISATGNPFNTEFKHNMDQARAPCHARCGAPTAARLASAATHPHTCGW